MTYKLPEPDYSRAAFVGRHTDTPIDHYYTADTLRAEVAAAEKRGRDEMRERCAEAAENGFHFANDGEQIAEKIRSLK